MGSVNSVVGFLLLNNSLTFTIYILVTYYIETICQNTYRESHGRYALESHQWIWNSRFSQAHNTFDTTFLIYCLFVDRDGTQSKYKVTGENNRI